MNIDVNKNLNGYLLKQENFDVLNLNYTESKKDEKSFNDKNFENEETTWNDENVKYQRNINETLTVKKVIESEMSENIVNVESNEFLDIIQEAENFQLDQGERESGILPLENVLERKQSLKKENSNSSIVNTNNESDYVSKENICCEENSSNKMYISNEILDSNTLTVPEISTEINMKEDNENFELIKNTLMESSSEKDLPTGNNLEKSVENYSSDIKIGEPNELINRPQHLPLGSESIEPNRKIDLIGKLKVTWVFSPYMFLI